MSGTLNKNVELFSDDKNKSNSTNCQSVELFAMSPSKQILISTNGDRIFRTRIFFLNFLVSIESFKFIRPAIPVFGPKMPNKNHIFHLTNIKRIYLFSFKNEHKINLYFL